MQVVVLGMHRSGTTLATRLLNLMGCSLGADLEFNPATEDNPRGFYERRDIWALSEAILAAAGCSWDDIADLDLDRIGPEERQTFGDEARRIVALLDAERPWVIKDPRLCLLMALWRPLLASPVCVLVHRSPLEIGRSLGMRDAFPSLVGVALWEHYTLAALRGSLGLPRLLVRHHDLVRDPSAAVRALLTALRGLGVDGLREPTAEQLAELVEPELYRSRGAPEEENEYLFPAQARLAEACSTGGVIAWTDLPGASDAGTDLLRRFAAQRRRTKHLAGQVSRMSRELEEMHLLAAQSHQEIDRLHQAAAESRLEVDRLHRLAAESHQEIDRLHAAVAEAKGSSSQAGSNER